MFILLASCIMSLGCRRDTSRLPEPRDALDRSLLQSVRANRLSDTKELLRRGANPNVVVAQQDGGDTPLVVAVREGHQDIIEALLAAGANVDGRDTGRFDGRTPLMWASALGRPEAAELLLRHGARANVRSGVRGTEPSALRWAIDGGHLECVTLLLASGAAVERRDLEAAITRGHIEIAGRLFEAGADPWWRFSDSSDVLDLAQRSPEQTRQAMIAVVRRVRRTESVPRY
jgi:ankyrin repeat protein